MALNTVSSDRLSTNVKNTNFTAAEKQDLTDDILPLAGQLGNRNLIINGAMQVAQRGTSFSAVQNTFTLDRFKFKRESTAANFTMAQSTTSPDGFAKSLKMTCTAADTSTASNEFVMVRYHVEAQDLQSLGYGTAAAKPLVLSFYVRSSLTGTYNINCLQLDNSNKIYSRTYTINSANTWEKKTISIPADTSGVINDDNGAGLQINFSLILGSTYKGGAVSTAWESYSNSVFGSQHGVNFGSSTSNDWHLTGVQLEVGSVATDFEHRSIGQELALCQRYYYRAFDGSDSGERPIALGVYENANTMTTTLRFANMRSSPTIDVTDASDAFMIRRQDGSDSFDTFTLRYSRVNSAEIVSPGTQASGNSGIGGMVRGAGATVYLAFSAEL